MFAPGGDFAPETLAVAKELLGTARAENVTAHVTLRRQNPEPLSELVVNFDDLAQQFAQTDHAWMLDA
jgi:hypothetical protein